MLNENENDLRFGDTNEPKNSEEVYPAQNDAYEDVASGASVHDDFSAAEEPVAEPQEPVQAQAKPYEPQQAAPAAEPAPASEPQPEPQPEPVFAEPQAESPSEPQSEPERVYAEPVGGYSSGQTVPPYGAPQFNAGSYTYGSQQNIPPYGAQRTASNPYSGAQPPYGQQPSYGGYTAAHAAPPAQPKSRKGLKTLLTLVVILVVAGLGIGVGAMIGSSHNRGRSSETAVQNNASPGVTAAADAPELETKASPASGGFKASGSALTPTEIAAKVKASSVGILVYSRASTGVASEGSGVVWKEDGSGTYTYIITCAHVVSGSNLTYTVQTCDGDTFDAELVGADSKTDLAVLRVKQTGLSAAEFGDSSQLQVGDPVYAIGNPGGTEFFGSFTSGIVSAIDRSVKSTNTTVCIQHTAAINPGNSGGALVNQYGQVIGINSQKIVNTQYEGMGFAIPIKSAQKIINNLATYGYVKDRPKLGITYAEAVNYQQYSMIIKIKGLPSGSLIITDINNDSTLKNTQAQQYDMIIRVNGEDMTKPEVLLDKIDNGKVGDQLTLTLCRIDNNYQTREFDVTVTLVEESKEAEKTESTTQQTINPYDFFNGDFFDGLF